MKASRPISCGERKPNAHNVSRRCFRFIAAAAPWYSGGTLVPVLVSAPLTVVAMTSLR